METKQFIEDAIKGGWGASNDWRPEIKSYFDFQGFYGSAGYHQLLLDPLAWEAVGKTRGWEEEIYIVHAHLFMTALMAQNKSIEEALTAIK